MIKHYFEKNKLSNEQYNIKELVEDIFGSKDNLFSTQPTLDKPLEKLKDTDQKDQVDLNK